MTKNQLIQLIHVAKSQLGLDDDTYRALLNALVGKVSCSDMRIRELETVLSALKDRGFKCTGTKRRYGKPAVAISNRRDDIKKIKAIWITMGQHGFIENPSDKALDAYVERMTKTKNHGIGIKNVAWLDCDLACHVLESLKKWHFRVLIDKFLSAGFTYEDNVLRYDTIEKRGYEQISRFLSDIIRGGKEVLRQEYLKEWGLQ